jgi:hypothetical protein
MYPRCCKEPFQVPFDRDLRNETSIRALFDGLTGTNGNGPDPNSWYCEPVRWALRPAPRGRGSVLTGPYQTGAQMIAAPGAVLRTPEPDDFVVDDQPYTSSGWRRSVWLTTYMDRSRPVGQVELTLAEVWDQYSGIRREIDDWIQGVVQAQLRNQIARLRPVGGKHMQVDGRVRSHAVFVTTVLDATDQFGEVWVRDVLHPWGHLVRPDAELVRRR